MTQDNRKSQKWQIERAKKRGSARARQIAFDMMAPTPLYPDRLSLAEIAEAAVYSPHLLQNLPRPQQPIPAAGASARPGNPSDASQAQGSPAARGIPPTRKR